jgi:RimJ/RimL family protein N-acetyltransferase
LLQWSGPAYQYPLDREQVMRHLASPAQRAYKAVERKNGEIIGHCELLAINPHHRSARIGRVLVGPSELRGKGYGASVIESILEIAFEEISLHRVDLGVYDFNASAIACYEKAGFRLEGLMRECVRDGDAWRSARLMSMLEEEWRERHRR